MRKNRVVATILQCADCDAVLAVCPHASPFGTGSGWRGDWFMVRDNVWRHGQRAGKCRFLCVVCLESRIDRKLSATDFKRGVKVNFDGPHSRRLRHRMRGLKPAKRLVETRFTP